MNQKGITVMCADSLGIALDTTLTRIGVVGRSGVINLPEHCVLGLKMYLTLSKRYYNYDDCRFRLRIQNG
jgi:hypothetical protein